MISVGDFVYTEAPSPMMDDFTQTPQTQRLYGYVSTISKEPGRENFVSQH